MRIAHWLPQDASQSTITACGLDIDKVPGISWSRWRMPHGSLPTCSKCRTEAIVRPGNSFLDRVDEAVGPTTASYRPVGDP